MAIALPDELQESVGPGSEGRVWQVGDLPAKHRANGCALEGPGRPIRAPDELQKSGGLGTNRALTAVRGRSAEFLKIIARADVPWSDV